MDISFQYDYAPHGTEELPLSELASFVLDGEGCPETSECSVTFVDDETMAELNDRFRGMEGPTDVLSFECDGLDDAFDEAFEMEAEASGLPEAPYLLGDIVIAPDVAYRQCAAYGTTFEGEMSLLLVHGLLHLCGYDHIEEDDAVLMERREAELLRAWCDALQGCRQFEDFGRADEEASLASLKRERMERIDGRTYR